ncbi:MAG TPA: XcyI family restriction endonuclease [Candidatus Angelobacter sp.]
MLVAARQQWFVDALSEALRQLDQDVIKKQLSRYVSAEAQRTLAAAGIRDEFVFPVPAVINAKPSLIGYYRLLLGAPQKSFYSGLTGMGIFKTMEETGTMSERQKALVPDFCQAMAEPLAGLVGQIPNMTSRDLSEMTLLTYGAQLQGSNNTLIGKKAMRDVFMAIAEIVDAFVMETQLKRFTVKNSSGRIVHIKCSHDPDVSIEETVQNRIHKKIAIEVKGGTDVSNAHNRAGEAEKSHLKSRNSGFPEFWTLISKKGLDVAKLRAESRTTNHWFDVAEVLARKGPDWDNFRQRLAAAVGIPVKD